MTDRAANLSEKIGIGIFVAAVAGIVLFFGVSGRWQDLRIELIWDTLLFGVVILVVVLSLRLLLPLIGELGSLLAPVIVGLGAIVAAAFVGLGWLIKNMLKAAWFVGVPLTVLYCLVRFVKWAWAD